MTAPPHPTLPRSLRCKISPCFFKYTPLANDVNDDDNNIDVDKENKDADELSEKDMDPEAWLAAQPDIDTSLDFEVGDEEEDGGTAVNAYSAGKPVGARVSRSGGGYSGLGRAQRDAVALKNARRSLLEMEGEKVPYA